MLITRHLDVKERGRGIHRIRALFSMEFRQFGNIMPVELTNLACQSSREKSEIEASSYYLKEFTITR